MKKVLRGFWKVIVWVSGVNTNVDDFVLNYLLLPVRLVLWIILMAIPLYLLFSLVNFIWILNGRH